MNKFIIHLIEDLIEKKYSAKLIMVFIWLFLKIKENGGEYTINNLDLAHLFKTSSSTIGLDIRNCGIFNCDSTKNRISVYKIKHEIELKLSRYEVNNE